MRDNLQGGVQAASGAAPLMVVCCGGVALAAITGAVGGWIGGVGGVALLSVAAAAALTWRSLRRSRAVCCETRAAPDGVRVQ
ncbi:MAG: hypothetical protein K0B00_13820 [Rhodobacteraceae bacterium]|nr:hypothetical protein [Paracoccaceae bacterium]